MPRPRRGESASSVSPSCGLPIAQSLDNGTVADWTLPGTSRRDLDQCPPDPLQVANLLIHIGNLGLRLAANIRAATIPLDLYSQQFFDLFKRESQCLSVFDEPQAFHGV